MGNGLKSWICVGLVSVLAAAAMTGCGGSDSTSSGSGTEAAGGETGSTQEGSGGTLKVALGSPTDLLDYVGVSKGFFEDQGVEVKLQENAGANTNALLTSGQADIAYLSAAGPALLNQQGRAATAIYATSGGGLGGAVVAASDLESFKALEELDSCVIATFPEGTAAYGWAVRYKKEFGLSCSIAPYQDGPSQLGALLAGRADAVVGSVSNFTTAIAAGKAHLIVDTQDPKVRQQYGGKAWPEVLLYGEKENLESKRGTVVSYIKGLDEAREWIEGASAKEVGEAIDGFGAYSTLPFEQVEENAAINQAYIGVGSEKGFISEASWKYTLGQLGFWELEGFDPTAPYAQYSEAVDMSYYEEALR